MFSGSMNIMKAEFGKLIFKNVESLSFLFNEFINLNIVALGPEIDTNQLKLMNVI